MSGALQGRFAFPGVKNVLWGSFTMSHGISPSMGTLYIAPQPGWISKQGPLEISYGSVKLKFDDCVADRLEVERDTSGQEVWVLHILDRRWKWRKCGRVSGYYNVRRGGGEDAGGNKLTSIVAGTEKSARDLAKLCLDALGETGYNVNDLPAEAWPETEWDYTRPADALAQLCDAYACRVVLQLNGRVKVAKIGEGKTLTLGETGLDGGVAVDSPEVPDQLVVVSAPYRWQYDFKLEPVGLDTDGSIKPIDDLSYAPDGWRPWTKSDPPLFNCVARAATVGGKTPYNADARQLAQETVFRWYRIKAVSQKDDQGFVPIVLSPFKDVVDDLDRILPIEDKQIITRKIGDRVEPMPAQVWGKFFPGYESSIAQIKILPTVGADLAKTPEAIYPGGFSVDRELGIVRFSQPVFLFGEGKDLNARLPAEIYLRTTVSLRDKETRGWLRKEFTREMPGPRRNTKPQYIRHDDVPVNIVAQGAMAGNNDSESEKAAEFYLDAAQKEYQTSDPSSFTYGGFVKIDLDGAIQQVSWMFGEDGFATTRASRNREDSVVTPSYQERRLIERIQAVVSLQKATPVRVQKELAEKSQA